MSLLLHFHKKKANLKASVEQELTNMSRVTTIRVGKTYRSNMEAMVAKEGGNLEE